VTFCKDHGLLSKGAPELGERVAAQRENNRPTSETNRILRDMSERMNPGTDSYVPAFG
jgi:hypothetical protein